MLTQLAVVTCCIVMAVAFMARKVFLALKRKSTCNCGSCPSCGEHKHITEIRTR